MSAATFSDAELRELARQLAVGALGAGSQTTPLRVALTAATPSRLAGQARYAAWLLRTGGKTSATTEPGTSVSARSDGHGRRAFPRMRRIGGGPAGFRWTPRCRTPPR
jgi:hypothetical protein